MRFTKIKFNGFQVQLTWIEKKGSSGEVESTLKSYERPDPELGNAMRAFVPIVFDLLDLLRGDWEVDFLVTGLSINEEDDGRKGLVITCLKKLEKANAPLVLNTPHLREPVEDEEFERTGYFTDGMLEALERAEKAARGYVEGKREQGDLFEAKQSEKEPEPEVFSGPTLVTT